MEKGVKGPVYRLEPIGGSEKIRVKIIAKRCNIKIIIPDKTYHQTVLMVERVVYPSKKSAEKKAIFKSLRGEGVLIRIFIQNELNSFYKDFVKEKNLEIGFYPYIKNYQEHEGCLELDFDTVAYLVLNAVIVSAVEPLVKPLVQEFVDRFKAHLKNKLKKLIDPDGNKNTVIDDNGNDKNNNSEADTIEAIKE